MDIKAHITKHIEEGPLREVEALRQARMRQPLRAMRKLLVEARERGDKNTEAILLALSYMVIHKDW